MPEPPVVCGVDPGVATVGLAVVGRDVRYSGTCPVPRLGSWATHCLAVHAVVAGLVRRYRPQILAIEWFT